MEPICFNLDNGLSLIILPEYRHGDDGQTCTFQLYYSSRSNEAKSLNDLNNYSGMISFERTSQEFYYTPGNLALSRQEILRLIEHIKRKIYEP